MNNFIFEKVCSRCILPVTKMFKLRFRVSSLKVSSGKIKFNKQIQNQNFSRPPKVATLIFMKILFLKISKWKKFDSWITSSQGEIGIQCINTKSEDQTHIEIRADFYLNCDCRH